MTDTKNGKPENPRKAIREARMARLKVINGPPKTIKVYAANETMRAALRHANGTRFRGTLGEGVEWPNDSFTKRRLAEGSISTEASSGGEPVEPDETKNPREQAEAMKPKQAAPKTEGKPAPKTEEKSEPKQRQPQPQPQPPAT